MIFPAIDRRGLDARSFAPPWMQSMVYRRRIRQSVAQLGSPQALVSPPETTLHRSPYGGLYACWKIETASAGTVYLKADRQNFCNESTFVVMTDIRRFYRAWAESSIAHGAQNRSDRAPILSDVPFDYKFEGADGPLRSSSPTNPVPLADVGAWLSNGIPHIGFVDGCTRTMWLLHHRADVIPFQTNDKESASILHRVAGIGPRPVSLKELFASQFAEH